jgi:hypothetical protein
MVHPDTAAHTSTAAATAVITVRTNTAPARRTALGNTASAVHRRVRCGAIGSPVAIASPRRPTAAQTPITDTVSSLALVT